MGHEPVFRLYSQAEQAVLGTAAAHLPSGYKIWDWFLFFSL
jgi:hypothetical protein